MKFQIIKGDVFKMSADILVFPANRKPLIGGSLDSQIYELAGTDALLKERSKYGELHIGDACITDSYAMKASYKRLIHAVTPAYKPAHKRKTAEKLEKCYLSALSLAEDAEASSVVFALLGAGASRFPNNKAIEAAKSAINQYCSEHPDSHIESAVVVVYEDESQYQLLIRFNRKLKEAAKILLQIDGLKDSVQINSYMGEIRTAIAKNLKMYADAETAQIKQAYQCEIERLSAEASPISAEDRLYKSIVKLPDDINQTEFAGRIYLQESSNVSQIVNLYSKNNKRYDNAFSFLKNKLNILKLGLGLELPFDEMCWLIWSRGHEFPISELDIELSEYYIKQGKSLEALYDYEEEFNSHYIITKSKENEKDL